MSSYLVIPWILFYVLILTIGVLIGIFIIRSEIGKYYLPVSCQDWLAKIIKLIINIKTSISINNISDILKFFVCLIFAMFSLLLIWESLMLILCSLYYYSCLCSEIGYIGSEDIFLSIERFMNAFSSFSVYWLLSSGILVTYDVYEYLFNKISKEEDHE